MSNVHFMIDKMLEFNEAKEIELPKATSLFLRETRVRANSVPPDLTMTEATLVEVLWRTYMKGG